MTSLLKLDDEFKKQSDVSDKIKGFIQCISLRPLYTLWTEIGVWIFHELAKSDTVFLMPQAVL